MNGFSTQSLELSLGQVKMADGEMEEVEKKDEEFVTDEKPELEEAKSEIEDVAVQDKVSLFDHKIVIEFVSFCVKFACCLIYTKTFK